MDADFLREYRTTVEIHVRSPKAVGFYLKWVQNFVKTFPRQPLATLAREDVESYLDILIKQNKYEERQLKQAKELKWGQARF